MTKKGAMLQILESQKKDKIVDEIYEIASEINLYRSKYIDPSYLPKRDPEFYAKPDPLPKKPIPKTSKYYGLTEEEHQEMLKQEREYRRDRLSKMTPEEKQKYNKTKYDSHRRWVDKNRERRRQYDRYYASINRDKINARKRARRAALPKEERRKEQDKTNIAANKWRERNPDFIKLYHRFLRRAIKLQNM